MNLKSEQRRLYDLLPVEARCFVRICDNDSALWVSDLPRKYEASEKLLPVLNEAGFSVWQDEQSRLWYLDWTQERWIELLKTLPQSMPALPEREEYHEAYALCRLLIAHPAVLQKSHMPMLRRFIKLTAEKPAKLLQAVRGLYEENAVCLRNGTGVSYSAGCVLAAWLGEQMNDREETKP